MHGSGSNNQMLLRYDMAQLFDQGTVVLRSYARDPQTNDVGWPRWAQVVARDTEWCSRE